MAELLHSTAQPQEGAVAELAELPPDHPPQPVEQLAMPQPGASSHMQLQNRQMSPVPVAQPAVPAASHHHYPITSWSRVLVLLRAAEHSPENKQVERDGERRS